MDLKNKVGFIVQGKFYSNNGIGHEANARKIIHSKGWSKEWIQGDAQDFLVLEKSAIQIGSGDRFNKIIASRKDYNESKLDRVVKKYKLDGYSYDLIS